MEKRCSKYRLHWLSWQPTPYNDFLFQTLSADPEIHLTIHFRERALASHPWQSNLAQGYRSRYYHRVLGVDWYVLSVAFRERDAFFVVAGWNHPTAILLINLLSLMKMHFAIWTDTPNLGRKRNRLFALLRSYWLKWVFQRATRVMGTGRPGIEALKIMGAPEDKLLVFPYFIDIDAYSCENRRVRSESNHAIRFISSGRLVNSAKGHDIALRALARAAHATGKEFEYYIAGTGKDEGELRRLANQLGISGKVKFLGWLEPDKLIQQLVYADVLIHPSPMHEPYGVAVIEGMASGLPVLASDVTCAASERIEHGVNGFIHPRGNVEVLAMQIGFLLRNPDMITEMGQLARKTAEQWPIDRGVQIIKDAVLEEKFKSLLNYVD